MFGTHGGSRVSLVDSEFAQCLEEFVLHSFATTKLLKIEPILRAYWNPTAFVNANSSKRGTEQQEDALAVLDSGSTKAQLRLDHALRSESFWATARLIGEIGFQAELLGRWCEGCACHQQIRCFNSKQNDRPAVHIGSCRWQGARAPELAVGDAMNLYMESMELSNHHLSAYLSRVPEQEQHGIRLDFEKAQSTLTAELMCKFAYWTMLPHILCGLAHPSPVKATQAAQRALKLWQVGGPATQHPMSKRFLDPGWKGLPGHRSEKPLREFVS